MNEESEQVLSWFTGFQKADLKEIVENLSVEQRIQLCTVLERERAEQVETFDDATRVSEQVLEVIGNEARQLGFATPAPCPDLTVRKLTDKQPEDSERFSENRRIRFADVVRKLNELLVHWEKRKSEGKK